MRGKRVMMASLVALLAVTVVVLLAMIYGGGAKPEATSSVSVRVIVSDRDNLQYMIFWVAKGAGYFLDEKIEVLLLRTMLRAGEPGTAERLTLGKDAEAAVLPPPRYLELIAQKYPLVIVANLLQNDPINLLVRRSVLQERKLSREAPIAERVKGLRGLRIGIVPNPRTRLRALFAAYELDADKDIEMVILRGPEQNIAFADHRVDAL